MGERKPVDGGAVDMKDPGKSPVLTAFVEKAESQLPLVGSEFRGRPNWTPLFLAASRQRRSVLESDHAQTRRCRRTRHDICRPWVVVSATVCDMKVLGCSFVFFALYRAYLLARYKRYVHAGFLARVRETRSRYSRRSLRSEISAEGRSRPPGPMWHSPLPLSSSRRCRPRPSPATHL